MASIQKRRSRGHTYWHIVESRRINGKPRAIPIFYLGKAEDLLARLKAEDALRIRSYSHGAVAALWAQAQELGVVDIIDEELAKSGRRIRPTSPGSASAKPDETATSSTKPSPAEEAAKPDPGAKGAKADHKEPPPRPPLRNDGLTVGKSLLLASIGRACRPTSKRGFAKWAATTTLGSLAGIEQIERLTSQHFWDQMDQVPIEAIGHSAAPPQPKGRNAISVKEQARGGAPSVAAEPRVDSHQSTADSRLSSHYGQLAVLARSSREKKTPQPSSTSSTGSSKRSSRHSTCRSIRCSSTPQTSSP